MSRQLRVAGKKKIQPAPPRPGDTKNNAWPTVAAYVSQTTILVALLYRIGWVRATATADYFGLDISLLGIAPGDYLLRSLNSVIRPALVFLTCTVAFLTVNRRLTRTLARPPHDRHRLLIERTLPAATLAGGILLVLGVVGILANITPKWPLAAIPPLAMFAGAGTLSYVAYLTRTRTEIEPGHQLRTLTLIVLSFGGLLLAVEKYADHVGHTIAINDAHALATRPEIRLHSTRKLDIGGAGISLGYDSSPEQAFHYRYDGLRLLIYNNNHFFLVSNQWERGKSKVFIVRDNDTVRIDPTASLDRQ